MAVQIFQIKQVQVLPIPLADAWTFFCDPRNLGAITPDWLCFDIRSEVPPCMYPGCIIEYRIKALAGLPMSWVTEITHVVAPNYFVDEQRFGPYRFWHHQHHFREVGEGVEMTDIVHYAMPYGILGLAVHKFVVAKRLEQIFAFRLRKLVEFFGYVR